MTVLKVALPVLMVLVFGATAYSQEAAATPPDKTATSQDKTAAAPKDDPLPIHRQGWQVFVAPYIWVPGANFKLARHGRFSGTTSVVDPWYDVVPRIFSQVFGAMGRVEVWKGRWGFFSNTVFIYLSDSVSAGGAKEILVNPGQKLPGPVPLRIKLTGDLKIWSRLLWQDVGVRFLVGSIPLHADKTLPVLSCELLGGLRYAFYDQDTRLGVNATLSGPQGNQVLSRGGTFSDSLRMSVVEPLLGVRLGFWLTPRVNLLLRGDIAGFGIVAYDSVDSVVEALMGYQVQKNVRLYAGYTAHYFVRRGKARPLDAHGWFHGPLLGAVFSF
ncbi:MAG: hypothetical protein WHT07_04165 [Desulfobaccales bacterium]